VWRSCLRAAAQHCLRAKPHAVAQVFEGVCTTYMQQLAVGSSVDVFLRVSKFKLPKQLNCPVIMIGVVCSTRISTTAFVRV
jgi:sulfite reductase alpha subunit-like flavoprotein